MQPQDNEKLREADQFVEELRRAVHHGLSDISIARELLRTILKQAMWKERVINMTDKRQEYREFVRFVTDPPVEGLDTTIDTLESLARGDVELESLLDEALQRPGGRPETFNIVKGFSGDAPVGNSAAYALRKLRSDAPELHARVLTGDLSPHAAMVEAGYRKKTIQIPTDPEGAARALIRKFTIDDLHRIVDFLAERIAVDS